MQNVPMIDGGRRVAMLQSQMPPHNYHPRQFPTTPVANNPGNFAYKQYSQHQNPPAQMYAQRTIHQNANTSNQMKIPQAQNFSSNVVAPAKMGIKSGMTVEDLKRLTQQRMQQTSKRPTNHGVSSAAANPTPSAASQNANARIINNGSVPVMPKTGMSVQELKQLTSLRLATQQNAAMPQPQNMGMLNKTMLSNVGKAHYRETLVPSSTVSSNPVTKYSYPMNSTASAYFTDLQSVLKTSNNMNFTPKESSTISINPIAHIKEFKPSRSSIMSSLNHQEIFNPLSSDEEDEEKDEDFFISKTLRFSDDAFPPPVENGAFVPSWSPPPTRSKKLDTIAPPRVPFYHQQYNMAKEYEAKDQNAIIAPPPGLVRRPSMTVPWQVAEAVLNTPQTTSARKTLMSPTITANSKRLDQVALVRGNSASGQSDASSSLSSLSAQLVRQRSGTSSVNASVPGFAAAINNLDYLSPGLQDSRRGSFGNAAEFFKFRRRSKSRLELAREVGELSAFSSIKHVKMPGIDEQGLDEQEVGDDGLLSNNASLDYASDSTVRTQAVTDRLNNMNISNDFVSFYQVATGLNNSDHARQEEFIMPPPPPPPPMGEEDDSMDGEVEDPFSSKGLPMMSPNGVRLRKVAELARRGSLSSEDKNRFKDEIIQSSLGIHATQAAKILTSKKAVVEENGTEQATHLNSTSVLPPPGFSTAPNIKAAGNGTHVQQKPPQHHAWAAKSISSDVTSQNSESYIEQPVPSCAANDASESIPLEERLRLAAKLVADCVSQGKMSEFQNAMKELDALRDEAATIMKT